MTQPTHAGAAGGVRYTRDVTPADVGTRVTLRRRLPPPDAGLGDVLGELLAWADGTLTVRRRDGSEVAVAEADVVALKRVPPAPVRPERPGPAAGS